MKKWTTLEFKKRKIQYCIEGTTVTFEFKVEGWRREKLTEKVEGWRREKLIEAINILSSEKPKQFTLILRGFGDWYSGYYVRNLGFRYHTCYGKPTWKDLKIAGNTITATFVRKGKKISKLKPRATILDDVITSEAVEAHKVKAVLYADKNPEDPTAQVAIYGTISARKTKKGKNWTGSARLSVDKLFYSKVWFDVENKKIFNIKHEKVAEEVTFSNQDDIFKAIGEAL